MKCGGQTVEGWEIHKYHWPTESHLIRTIEFVSSIDKHWNHKNFSIILDLMCIVWKTFIPRRKVLLLPSILKQTKSLLLIHLQHLEIGRFVYKLRPAALYDSH